MTPTTIFVAAALLAVCAWQAATATDTARRKALRTVRRTGAHLTLEEGAEVEQALTRRARWASTGCALGVLGGTALAAVAAPPVDFDRYPQTLVGVSLMLAACICSGVVAECLAVVTSNPEPPDGPRVAALGARDLRAYLSPAELRFPPIILASAMVATVVALVRSDPSGRMAAVVLLIGVLVALVVLLTVRRVLHAPSHAATPGDAAAEQVLVAATVERFAENAISATWVFWLYVLIATMDAITPEVGILVIALGMGLFATVWLAQSKRNAEPVVWPAR